MLADMVKDSQALDRAIAGEELSYKDGLELMNYDNLHLLAAVADNSRKKLVGDTVTFAASYYMNYTNVCAASCQMCAFYRKEGADDAYTLTLKKSNKELVLQNKWVQLKFTLLEVFIQNFHWNITRI